MDRFTLVIDCENDAFTVGPDGLMGEVARILEETAEDVRNGMWEGSLRDANGNRVGKFELKPI